MTDDIDELRGKIVALTALVQALVDTHPDPTSVRMRFAELAEQATASLPGPTDNAVSDRAGEAARRAVQTWLRILAERTPQRG
jgi:hypothetical protein